MASIPLVQERTAPEDLTWQAIGTCERVGAVVLFAALIPLLAACALMVSLLSRRSPFIAHRRVGWRGMPLWMIKLRTMWDDDRTAGWRWIEYIDDHTGPKRKHVADPRVPHGFARFCRRHSIDEIPQLWHVIRGEMALVGPRPATLAEVRQHYGPAAEELLRVRPGMAGLWQTSGRNRLTYAQRRELDLRYVRERSVAMYLRILVRTLPEVWSGANSW